MSDVTFSGTVTAHVLVSLDTSQYLDDRALVWESLGCQMTGRCPISNPLTGHISNSISTLIVFLLQALMAQAVHRVYLLSKEDRTIVTYPNLIDGLLRAARSDDPNVRRDAAGALSHLSEKKEGCVHIFRSGGLAELIRMLYNSVEVAFLGDLSKN